MKISATELARDSKRILDAVVLHNEKVEIQRRGKTVAEIRAKRFTSGPKSARKMKKHPVRSRKDAENLKHRIDLAMEKVFGNGHSA